MSEVKKLEKNFYIKELDVKKDENILYDIVEYENKIFGEGSIGNWNIKPFTKYGKVIALLHKNILNEEIVSIIEILKSFEKDTAYIYGLFTVSKYEGKGYAKTLLEYTIKKLDKFGIKNIELTVEVNNKSANALYEKLGFRIVEELEDEYKDGNKRYLRKYCKK